MSETATSITLELARRLPGFSTRYAYELDGFERESESCAKWTSRTDLVPALYRAATAGERL